MTRSRLPLVLAALLASCSGASSSRDAGSAADVGAMAPCLTESDCQSGEYCKLALEQCADGYLSRAISSTCEPMACGGDCHQKACQTHEECAPDEMCESAVGGQSCAQGTCCLKAGRCTMVPNCPSGCQAVWPAHTTCFACVCPTCPAADAGATFDASADAGPGAPFWCALGGEVDAGVWALSPCPSLVPGNDIASSEPVVSNGIRGKGFDGGFVLQFYQSTYGGCCTQMPGGVVIETASAIPGDYQLAPPMCDAGVCADSPAKATLDGVRGSGLMHLDGQFSSMHFYLKGQIDVVFQTASGPRRLLTGFEAPLCQ